MNADPGSTSVCRKCNERPASTTYTNRTGKRSELVCGSCLDLLELQEDFGWGIYAMEELDEQERYDEMLALLDAFEAANRYRDQGHWLARNTTSQRALILWQAKRYEESLVECEKREKLGFESVWHRWVEGSAKASALEGLGRHEEALAVFEEAFRYQEAEELGSVRNFLPRLVKFSANADKPVDESWRELAKTVAADYEVDLPVRPTLAESIMALFELTENKLSSRQRAEQAKKS